MEHIMTEVATPPHDPPPPPGSLPSGAAAPQAPKRLYRDPYGMIGGVASGMAGYFGVDPVLVRLLWLVALISGIGFFAYPVFWLIVPKARVWPPPGYAAGPIANERPTSAGSTLLTGLVVVALAAVIGSQLGGLGDLVLPVALVGFGIYLLNQRASAAEDTAARGTPSNDAAPGAGVLAATERDAEAPAGFVTPLVLSGLALLGGVAWALHSLGVITLSLTTAASAALIIVGLGSIASLWLGRARGLIPLGIVIGSVLLVASAAEPWWRAREQAAHAGVNGVEERIGTRVRRVTALPDLQKNYTLALGELTVDLSELDLQGTTQKLHAGVGLGELTLIVPANASLRITGEVGLGEARALDMRQEGIDVQIEKVDEVETNSSGELIIAFEVGMGEGTVRRAD